MLVELEEMKNYLRIDYNDDDNLIEDLIKECEIYIESCCGVEYKKNTKKIQLAKLILKKMVFEKYENRSIYIDKKSNFQNYDRTTMTIFDILASN